MTPPLTRGVGAPQVDAAITGAAPATVTAGMLPAAPRATERREMGLVMWIPQAMKRFVEHTQLFT